jgi:hypothetical protein
MFQKPQSVFCKKNIMKTIDTKSVCKMPVIIYKLHCYYDTTAVQNMDFRVTF